MAKLIDTNTQDWQPVRPELTEGVVGQLLLDGPTKLVLARVAADGCFRPHRDNYRHLFHILEGEGLFRVEEHEFLLSAGMALQVEAGELHGYENRGADDLLLISANLPIAEK